MEISGEWTHAAISLATLIFLAGGTVTYLKLRTRQQKEALDILTKRVEKMERCHEKDIKEITAKLEIVHAIDKTVGKLQTHIEWLVKEVKNGGKHFAK